MIETMNLWPFRKRISLQDRGIFSGFTDWHSHILPGVDDGAVRDPVGVGCFALGVAIAFWQGIERFSVIYI